VVPGRGRVPARQRTCHNTPVMLPAVLLFHFVPSALLVAAIAYFSWYFHRHREAGRVAVTPGLDSRTAHMLLAGMIVFGVLLRFVCLGSLFEGITFDESYKGLDAIGISEFGERPLFLDWNGGREALVAYAITLTQRLFGYSATAVRAVTAVAGSLTLIFFYLLVGRLAGRRLALTSTFLLTFSKYHIIQSRYGVRAGLVPLFEVASLYFLARGLLSEGKRTPSFLAAGLTAGLGFHTYLGYRIFPLIVLFFLFQKEVRKHLREKAGSLAAAAALCAALVIPLAVAQLSSPSSALDRMERTLLWKQGDARKNPIRALVSSTAATFGMFSRAGDTIARHNLPGEPMLSPFLTGFWWLGLLVCVFRRAPCSLFFLSYFLAALLPGILSVGAPNAARAFGALPPAIFMTAAGLAASVDWLAGVNRKLSFLLPACILGGTFTTGINDAMFRHPAFLDSLDTKTAALWGMDRDHTELAELVKRLGPKAKVFLTPQFYFHAAMAYRLYPEHRVLLFAPGYFPDQQLRPGEIGLVVTQPEEMNLWWLRDDDGKMLFHWWEKREGWDTRQIRALIRRSYVSYPRMMQMSDSRLIAALLKEYPRARRLNAGHFTVFFIGYPGQSRSGRS
jgi:hypothetical protein